MEVLNIKNISNLKIGRSSYRTDEMGVKIGKSIIRLTVCSTNGTISVWDGSTAKDEKAVRKYGMQELGPAWDEEILAVIQPKLKAFIKNLKK